MPPSKVKIQRIASDRTRQNTFHKRKLGLLKKAMELTVLCGCDCAIIIRSGPTAMFPEGKILAYCNKNMDEMLAEYTHEMPSKHYTNADYSRFGKEDCDSVGCGSLPEAVVIEDEIADMASVESLAQEEAKGNKTTEQRAALQQQIDRLQSEVSYTKPPLVQLSVRQNTNCSDSALHATSDQAPQKRGLASLDMFDSFPSQQQDEDETEQPTKRQCIAPDARTQQPPKLHLADEERDDAAGDESFASLVEELNRSTDLPPEGFAFKRERSSSISLELAPFFHSSSVPFLSPCNRLLSPRFQGPGPGGTLLSNLITG